MMIFQNTVFVFQLPVDLDGRRCYKCYYRDKSYFAHDFIEILSHTSVLLELGEVEFMEFRGKNVWTETEADKHHKSLTSPTRGRRQYEGRSPA